ncbi:hypothetical protein [Pedobacter sp. AJM]|uniref:hypothetical protein n=1 Tax=Pedobacter sp. AJM TaxID=2003629 RepID=UPI000B4BE975|nr:hypothetical protein [Pedobacter sp. AJM]MCX2429539.1 hypothetical protein [Pedobacter sp. GR22-10]OWK70837.1 hypothetical protein CBW18_06990 [Pedobacter sp. AJM]
MIIPEIWGDLTLMPEFYEVCRAGSINFSELFLISAAFKQEVEAKANHRMPEANNTERYSLEHGSV